MLGTKMYTFLKVAEYLNFTSSIGSIYDSASCHPTD